MSQEFHDFFQLRTAALLSDFAHIVEYAQPFLIAYKFALTNKSPVFESSKVLRFCPTQG